MVTSRSGFLVVVGGLFLMVGCGVEDEGPREPLPLLESVDLVGLEAGDIVEPGERVSVTVRTRIEAVSAVVDVQLLAVAQDGVVESLLSAPVEVSAEGEARVEWFATGEGLEPGVYEVYAQVFRQGEALESERISFVWNPRFGSVELVSVMPGQEIVPGERVNFEVVGTGLRRQVVGVDVLVHSLGTSVTRKVETLEVTFDDASGVQRARGSWVVSGAFLDQEDTLEIAFVVSFAEAQVASSPFIVIVGAEVDQIELRALINGEERILRTGEEVDLRFVDRIIAEVKGRALAGQQLTFRAREGLEVVNEEVIESRSGGVQWAFDPPRTFAEAPLYNLSVEVVIDGQRHESVTAQMRRWGFVRCVWLFQNGTEIAANADFRSPVNVLLHAETWGVPNREVRFTIKEDDGAAGSDTTARIDGPLEDDRATVERALEYEFDGLGDESEYFFEVSIAGDRCRSPLLNVVED